MMSRVKANGWQTAWRCLCTKLVLILRFLFLNRDTHRTFTHALPSILSLWTEPLVVSTCWFKTARLFPPIRSWCGCNTMLFNIYPLLFFFFNLKISNSHFLHVIMTHKKALAFNLSISNASESILHTSRNSKQGSKRISNRSCCSCHSFFCQITNQIRFPKLDECQFVNESCGFTFRFPISRAGRLQSAQSI
jgi:hypothetical protein